MTRTAENLKATMLGLAILIGFALQCTPVKAADQKVATLAGGCFWCVESDFEGVPGVIEVVSGFTGGDVQDPSYKEVVRGGTGHVEAVQVTYNPGQITYDEILHKFFRSVDPTDDRGQFCDRGFSYTTAIFVSNSAEKASAEKAKAEAEAALGKTVVTPIRDTQTFYPAPEYHQDFYKKSEIIVTRFGPRKKSEAYKRYRKGCKRDARVLELWGDEAPFALTN